MNLGRMHRAIALELMDIDVKVSECDTEIINKCHICTKELDSEGLLLDHIDSEHGMLIDEAIEVLERGMGQ